MIKLSHATLITISGLVWLCVGVFLLQLGIKLMLAPENLTESHYTPLLSSLSSLAGGYYEAATAIIAIALYVGFLKGKHVLQKAARKGVDRIHSFPNPTGLQNLYSAKYYILLAVMIGLGASMRFFGIPNDIRGAVDVAVGTALISGALEYFRLARLPAVSSTP